MREMRFKIACRGCRAENNVVGAKPSYLMPSIAKFTCWKCESKCVVSVKRKCGDKPNLIAVRTLLVERSEKLNQILYDRNETNK